MLTAHLLNTFDDMKLWDMLPDWVQINRYVHKQNNKIIETGNRLQSLFSDGFVQIPCIQEKPSNAYGISV